MRSPPGRPVHLDHPQRRRRHLRADRGAVRGARRRRARRVPGLPAPTRGGRRHHHRDRGGLPRRRRSAAGRRPRGRGRRSSALRSDPRGPVASLPARLVAGLLARRAAGAGPITVLSCDNLPENGAVAGPWSRSRRPGGRPAARAGSTTTSTSPPRWSTGSPRPRPTTTERWSQQPAGTSTRIPVADRAVQRVGDLGRVPGRPAARGRRPAPRIVDDVAPVRAAQAVAAERLPLACWPTPAASGAMPRSTRPSPTRPAGPGSRRSGTRPAATSPLPAEDIADYRGRPADPLLQPADRATSWPRSRPTAPPSSRSGPCRRSAPSGPPGGSRSAAPPRSPPGSCTCAASAPRSRTQEPPPLRRRPIPVTCPTSYRRP